MIPLLCSVLYLSHVSPVTLKQKLTSVKILPTGKLELHTPGSPTQVSVIQEIRTTERLTSLQGWLLMCLPLQMGPRRWPIPFSIKWPAISHTYYVSDDVVAFFSISVKSIIIVFLANRHEYFYSASDSHRAKAAPIQHLQGIGIHVSLHSACVCACVCAREVS